MSETATDSPAPSSALTPEEADALIREFERSATCLVLTVTSDPVWLGRAKQTRADCIAKLRTALLAAPRREAEPDDSELLNWLQASHRGVEAITMDDQFGEPTRKLFVVDGAGPDAMMSDVRGAISRARERYSRYKPEPSAPSPEREALHAEKLVERKCPGCGHARVSLCVVTSDDGGHADDRYTCPSCRHVWWVDGIDS